MKKNGKIPSPYEKFAALSESQKEEVYRELDDPNIALKAKPMSARMKKLWEKAKRKGGRPRVGLGATRVLISIERGLLEDADAFARQRRLTRSELFSRGVKAVLAKAG
jgi:hypothetical protein